MQMQTADILNWQSEQIKTQQNEYIGKVWMIILEASKDAAVPDRSVTGVLGTRLEFYADGLPIAQTLDHSTLLLLAPVKRKDGLVGLPDIPDPTWTPPIPKPHEIEGLAPGKYYQPPEAPRIAQRLEDRARGQLKGTDYLVFGPVAQILIRPEGIAEGWIAECFANPADGTQMDLLISKSSGRAHLFGGKYRISRVG